MPPHRGHHYEVSEIGDFDDVAVTELLVNVGDKVKGGSAVVLLDAAGAASDVKPAVALAACSSAAPDSVAVQTQSA